jgi:H+/Cl- antiporter ClcA
VPHIPAYEGTHLADLLVAPAVGVATALLIRVAKRIAAGVEGTRRIGMPALLLAGGLAVGLVAELADVLGATSQDVLFSGQASVSVEVGADSTKVVLVLLACKLFAYAVSLGCGFRGGAIFPAVFLGVGVASLPVVWFGVSPTLAIAVGAAAGMAAGTRLLFAPLLFALLLVGKPGLDATPAAVFAAVAAWLTLAALDARDQ